MRRGPGPRERPVSSRRSTPPLPRAAPPHLLHHLGTLAAPVQPRRHLLQRLRQMQAQRGLSCNDGLAPSLCRGQLLRQLAGAQCRAGQGWADEAAARQCLRRESRRGSAASTRGSAATRGFSTGAAPHLHNVLLLKVCPRPVRGSQALRHPLRSSAALPGARFAGGSAKPELVQLGLRDTRVGRVQRCMRIQCQLLKLEHTAAACVPNARAYNPRKQQRPAGPMRAAAARPPPTCVFLSLIVR